MKKLIILVLLMSWFTFACSDGPDLVPHEEGMYQFCIVNDSNELLVSVRNNGNMATTIPVPVIVDFGGFPSVTRTLPPMLVGEVQTLSPVAFPAGCFNPDCGLEIIVDPLDVLDEKNETNNTVIGNCIG